MEEITLTGGTLVPNNKNNNTRSNNNNAVVDPLASNSNATSGSTNVFMASSHYHNHGHGSGSSHNKPVMVTLEEYQKAALYSAHSHNHGEACCSAPQPLPMPVLHLKMKACEMVQKQSTPEILQALKILTKMGQYSLLQEIIQAWEQHKGKEWLDATLKEHTSTATDHEGHSLLHWAAKRTDDVRFVQFWSRYIPLTVSTTDGTGMTPLHWACTEPDSFAIIQYLLTWTPQDKKAPEVDLLSVRDASGCTPLLLAAQHGHVETVAFLVHQFQAHLDHVDDNGDSATHWAAYKGSQAVLGLLAYYEKQNHGGIQMLQKPDAYGQTPLHLAALRGHSSACQYILKNLVGPQNSTKKVALQMLRLPDKNGRTPFQLAVHKNKPHTAACLQQAERSLSVLGHRPRNKTEARVLFQTIFVDWLCNAHRWKTWFGIPTGQDDPMDVAPSFPNYYVFAAYMACIWFHYTVFVPLFALQKGVLWDCTFLHLVQLMAAVAVAYSLYQTQTTNPGRLDDSCPEIGYWRRMYGETLASYANTNATTSLSSPGVKKMQLCHTCHIARPPRSKHDRHSGVCVLLFDHCCPFVGNSIGLYNYKWFYLLLVSMTVYLANHLLLLIIYCYRRGGTMSWLTLVIGILLGGHLLFSGPMLVYHTQLCALNLTTNEHANMHKYDYFWTNNNSASSGLSLLPDGANHHQPQPQQRQFKNPWFRGYWGNFWDRFQPSHSSYLLPEQQETLLSATPGDGSLRNCRTMEMV